jgi:type IV secretory pathway VirB10-like protein
MTREGRLGGSTLPSGTELHGTVQSAGYGEGRVFVTFNFALLDDGSSIDFTGIARDTSGRPGIPGRKVLNKDSAGSVGISALGRAISHAGQAFAGQVGGIIGAGVEGATDSAANKTQRMDRDEAVVVVDAYTPMVVYVQALGGGSGY